MIELDSSVTRDSLVRLSGAIAAKAKEFHLTNEAVLRVEGGRLCEEMIKRAPPKSIQKTKQKITSDVKHKFATLSPKAEEQQFAAGRNKLHSDFSGDVTWYDFTTSGIYGVASPQDFRNANVDGLKAVYYETKVNKLGRRVVGQRGKQTVYLWQQYLTRKATVNALVEKIKKNIGRLKASFLPALRALQSAGFKSSYTPPEAALNNESVAKGSINMNLHGDEPFVEIISNAIGAESETTVSVANQAMRSRAESITTRMAMIHEHPELRDQEL